MKIEITQPLKMDHGSISFKVGGDPEPDTLAMHNKTRSPLFKPCGTAISRLLLLTGVEAWLEPQIRTTWLGAVSVGAS